LRAPVTVRPATPADFDAISEIAQITLPFETGYEDERARDMFRDNVLNWRRLRRSTTVAVADGGVVGFVGLAPYRSKGGPVMHSASLDLTQLAVREEHRGFGIGTRLLEEARRTATGLGAGIVYALVSSDNASFYERNGWTVGQPNDGLAFIEDEKTEDAVERVPGDILGVIDKAAPVRGGAADLGHGYNRFAYQVLDPHAIQKVFFYPPSDSNPEKLPLMALFEQVRQDHNLVKHLPFSTVLMLMGDLRSAFGKESAIHLLKLWMDANPEETKRVPQRMKLPDSTAPEIFTYLMNQ
jgi:GNAT superfamily N-acetyltransferase